MGSIYRYECPDCSYTIQAGNDYDRGFYSCCTTISCEQCQEVYDIQISEELYRQAAPNGVLTKPDISCPKDPIHEVITWDKACPKCNGKMKTVSLVMDWD